MISGVRLKNFKCFEDQLIRFSGVTMLAGMNGMGKSSVMQALLLLRQSHIDGVLEKRGLELDGSLIKLGTAKDVFYESALTDILGIELSWEGGHSESFSFAYDQAANVLKSIEPKSSSGAVLRGTPFSGNLHYVQAERLGPRTINEVSDFLVREHRQIGTAGQFAGHFLSVYEDESVDHESLLHDKAPSEKLIHQVGAWLQEISPGTELHHKLHSTLDLVNLSYSFATGEQRSNLYRSTAVGFGITYALPVILAIVSSKPGNLVMIENPEAHLHPRGQSKMGLLIAKAAEAGIQVLVETHSDHVLNAIRVAVYEDTLAPDNVALHYFSREEFEGRVRSRVESPTINQHGRLTTWPDGFFDESDKALEKLMGYVEQAE